MFDTLAVANWLISRAQEKGLKLTPMQLQKLLYFAHGWFLALTGKPLLKQPIEAWQYGPVVSDIYHSFKKFGSNVITAPISPSSEDAVARSYSMDLTDPDFPAAAHICDQVLDLYGKLSGPVLMGMTHAEGSPWSKFYGDGCHWSREIKNEEIKEYFDNLASNKRLY